MPTINHDRKQRVGCAKRVTWRIIEEVRHENSHFCLKEGERRKDHENGMDFTRG
jgi:hypothetical protein